MGTNASKINKINIIYEINKHLPFSESKIKIFGSEFVKNNKNNCKMIIDNKEYEIAEEYNVNNNEKLQITLNGINNVIDVSFMFDECYYLSSFPDIHKWNTDNITNMSHMFNKCYSLQSLPDISKWNINKANDISNIFNKYIALLSLPDISKWNTGNVTNMSYMFNEYNLYLIFQNGILIKQMI